MKPVKLEYEDILRMKKHYDELPSAQIASYHREDILAIINYAIELTPEKEKAQKPMPIASLCMSNTASLNIWNIFHSTDDYVVVSINDKKRSQHKIYTIGRGQYFVFGGMRYYLNEFLKL